MWGLCFIFVFVSVVIRFQAGLVRASLEGLQKKMAAADYATKVPARVQTENSEKVGRRGCWLGRRAARTARLRAPADHSSQAATLEEELTTIARAAELFKSLRE
jgi:hypothetical protein